jgi:PadR family transcriptional regulator PadR
MLVMQVTIDNWKVQVKKGYLELCLLVLIRKNKRMYGLELLETLSSLDLQLKEGTLYPLLNRLTEEGLLASTWETENVKGHPRKFYALTKRGVSALIDMETEFNKMVDLISTIKG